jgi:phosphoglycolate phosphatase-like HAD superfamily hydrolase
MPRPLLLLALLALAEGPAAARGSSGLAFCRRALSAGGARSVCVFDIDNTLVDTRYRTRAAAEAFARRHPGARSLAGLPIGAILRDGRSTALRAGLDPRRAEAFHRFWEGFFWSPRNFRCDAPLSQTVALAARAKAAGAEVYYLTGRIERLKPGTLAELAALGLPDADAKHVLCKPSIAVSTGSFKRAALVGLRASGKKLRWFMTDSRGEIAALAGARVPSVLVDFPVNAPNETSLRRPVPTIRVGR